MLCLFLFTSLYLPMFKSYWRCRRTCNVNNSPFNFQLHEVQFCRHSKSLQCRAGCLCCRIVWHIYKNTRSSINNILCNINFKHILVYINANCYFLYFYLPSSSLSSLWRINYKQLTAREHEMRFKKISSSS